MLRRLKRTRDFELALEIKTDTYIAPPREAQRNWLVNRALGEFARDLDRLDQIARGFVPGQPTGAPDDRTQATLSDDEIMEDWQLPIMKAMADVVTEAHGDVLEIGFGLGISAEFIQERGVRSHTIVECNDSVVERFHAWKERHPDRDIRLIHARWQDAVDRFQSYDGVFFHTFPLTEDEFLDTVVNSATFAEHFFSTAAAALRKGGIFTYMTNEIDSLSREHQRSLLTHFRTVAFRLVENLDLPDDVRDAWWAKSMIVVGAEK